MTSNYIRAFLNAPWPSKLPIPLNRIVSIQSLSARLSCEDFLRTLPFHSKLKFARIIPVRDRLLERNNSYILVFSTPEDASQYLKHLSDLKAVVSQHAVTSILSSNLPIGPDLHTERAPRNKIKDSQVQSWPANATLSPTPSPSTHKHDFHLPNVATAIDHFTLVPPSQPLIVSLASSISLVEKQQQKQQKWQQQQPNSSFYQDIARLGVANSRLAMSDRRRMAYVLLRIVGVRLSLRELLMAIVADGVRRGVGWDIKMYGPPRDDIDRSGRVVGKRRNKLDHLGVWPVNPEIDEKQTSAKDSDDDTTVENFLSINHRNATETKKNSVYGGGAFAPGQRYAIAFRRWENAHLFVREWHGKEVPWPYDQVRWRMSQAVERIIREKRKTMVHAEVLW